jgi:hypothetical protein
VHNVIIFVLTQHEDNTAMTKEAIKQLPHDLSTLLPKGAIKEISETTGLDRNSVRMILLGIWSNEAVIQAALSILDRQRAAIEETTAILSKSNNFMGSTC